MPFSCNCLEGLLENADDFYRGVGWVLLAKFFKGIMIIRMNEIARRGRNGEDGVLFKLGGCGNNRVRNYSNLEGKYLALR